MGWVIVVYRVDKSVTPPLTLAAGGEDVYYTVAQMGVDPPPSCGIMTAGGIACVLTKIRHIFTLSPSCFTTGGGCPASNGTL